MQCNQYTKPFNKAPPRVPTTSRWSKATGTAPTTAKVFAVCLHQHNQTQPGKSMFRVIYTKRRIYSLTQDAGNCCLNPSFVQLDSEIKTTPGVLTTTLASAG